jgi:hypothetical protein
LPPSIKWKVITPDVTKRWNTDINNNKQKPYVYVGLSSKDYLLFTGWLKEIIVYLRSQKLIKAITKTF